MLLKFQALKIILEKTVHPITNRVWIEKKSLVFYVKPMQCAKQNLFSNILLWLSSRNFTVKLMFMVDFFLTLTL